MERAHKLVKASEESGGGMGARQPQNGINLFKSKEYMGNAAVTVLPIAGWLIFSAVPIVLSFIMMFFSMRESSFEGATFVGMGNFVKLFTEYRTKLGYSLLNTLLYSLKLPISIVLSLWISVMLDRVKNATTKNILRTVFFITYI